MVSKGIEESYLDKLSNYAGGTVNVNDIFIDALRANGSDANRIVFHNLLGMQGPDHCGNNAYACWNTKDETIYLSDYIFQKPYQDSRTRPKELGLQGNTNLGVEVTIGHEIDHVFSDARPVVAPEYYLRFFGGEEDMANTFAFYITTGKYDWPGRAGYFDFVREISPFWSATP